MRFPEHLDDEPHGVLSRRRLLSERGITSDQVDTWLRNGTLLLDRRGCYRRPGAPSTLLQGLAAAVCAVDGHAADDTVLGLHGAAGFPLQERHTIAIAPHRRLRRSDLGDLRIVRVSLAAREVEVRDGIPAMRVERALIGVFPRTHPARFRAAFHDLRRRGVLDVARVQRCAVLAGKASGAAELLGLLASGALLSESPPEHDLGAIWQPGDPRPQPQVWVQHRGTHYRLDWVFPASRLAPEYDGEEAHLGTARHRDAKRTLALAELAIHRIPVTAPMLRRPEGLREQLLTAHVSRIEGGIAPLVPCEPPAWWNGL